jgi:hypothetical protein
MCMLCNTLGGGRRWSDLGRDVPARRQERQARQRLLERILGHYGMELRPWAGEGYLLARPGGPTQLVNQLAGIWPAVEAAGGGRCDPLEPSLIAALSAEGP